MKNKKLSQVLMLSAVAAAVLASNVQAEAVTVYGKAHVSADYMNMGDTTEIAVASNSSRLGFKGDKALSSGFTGVWQIENEIDMTAEKAMSMRNHYLGLKHSAGTVLVGYHDTPFKSFGGKAGVFHDTIAERRGILGAGAAAGNKFNNRAKNSVMYISPSISGLELRVMASSGDDTATQSDGDANGVMSYSAVYSQKGLYAGVAYEDQGNLSATEGTGIRAGAGATFGATTVNAMYETLSSDTKDEFSRAAYGGSVVHKLGNMALKAQLFMAGDYKDMDNSGGMLYAVGADYKLDKSFTMYALYTAVSNDANAKFVLAGSGHGEKYTPAAAGDDISGISAGMIMKF